MNRHFELYAFADEADGRIDGQIAAMKRNHLRGLEIRNVDAENISAISAAKAREVRQKMDAAGLKVWSLGSPFGKICITEDFAPHLELFRRNIDLAHILGAEKIRLFSFYIPQEQDPSPYRDAVMERLSRFLEAASGSGVTLCHENEKGIYGDLAPRCLDIHKTFPEIRAIFDPANFIQCGQDTLEAFAMLKPYIEYMHIKDALPDGRVVPAGMGTGALSYLLENCPCSALTIEPHLQVFDGLSALEANAQAGGVFTYPNSNAAFDAACFHLKQLIGKGASL